MSANELASQLRLVLGESEARGREPHRVLEVVACLVHELDEVQESTSELVEKLRHTITVWEQGDRPDLDALETIAALVRQV